MGFLKGTLMTRFDVTTLAFMRDLWLGLSVGANGFPPLSLKSQTEGKCLHQGRLGWVILSVVWHCIRQTGQLRYSINNFRNRDRPDQT
jgi:hypothetical protein